MSSLGMWDMNTVTSSIEAISPTMALSLLEMNKNNRSLRMVHVKRLANDIVNGRWEFTGAPVVLDPDGHVLDGQHRLRAVVMADKSVRMVIIRGVSREAQTVMDIGRKRTTADHLNQRGYKNYNTLGGALRLIHLFGLNQLQAGGEASFTPADSFDALARHPLVEGSVSFILKHRQDLGTLYRSHSQLAFLHYLFARVDSAKADEFIVQLSTGVGLVATDPVLHLRSRLMKAMVGRHAAMPQVTRLFLVIKAWNSFYKGKPMKSLRLGPRENLPRVAGYRYGKDGLPVWP